MKLTIDLQLKKRSNLKVSHLNDIQTSPSQFFFPFIYFWVANCIDSFHLQFLHLCHYCTRWPWLQDILLRSWDGIHLYSHRWWRWCKCCSHNHRMHSRPLLYRHFQLQTCRWHLVYRDPWFKQRVYIYIYIYILATKTSLNISKEETHLVESVQCVTSHHYWQKP